MPPCVCCSSTLNISCGFGAFLAEIVGLSRKILWEGYKQVWGRDPRGANTGPRQAGRELGKPKLACN